MITEVEIANFKSIRKVKLELGRFNVLIGENGCGKSNLLEAIAFAGAAAGGKASHEFMASRGIRWTDPRLMRSAFLTESGSEPIVFRVRDQGNIRYESELKFDDTLLAWTDERLKQALNSALYLKKILAQLEHSTEPEQRKALKVVTEAVKKFWDRRLSELQSFLIYSPENTALRNFHAEGQILPLGVSGEGLFDHVRTLISDDQFQDQREALISGLQLLDWLDDFKIPEGLWPGERKLAITDRYLLENIILDQRSVNEGFLFLLFTSLCLSARRPRRFLRSTTSMLRSTRGCVVASSKFSSNSPRSSTSR